MSSSGIRAVSGRTVGLVATACALALAVALGITMSSAHRTEARLQARIAQMDRQLTLARAIQRAQATRCARGMAPPAASAGGDPAQRLLQAPPGFDVCARMENADQAVLDSLG